MRHSQITTSLYNKLSGRRLSLVEMADLLEKHVGAGASEQRCKEAVEALLRLRGDYPGFYVRAVAAPLDRGGEPCALVREVVLALRKWHHFSGA